MVIHKFFILSLVAAGAAVVGSSAPTMAQGVRAAAASQGRAASKPVADGELLISADDLSLAEGETIVTGPGDMGLFDDAGHPVAMHPGQAYPAVLDPGIAGVAGGGCFAPCNPGYYGIAEVLYMRREGDEGFNLSNSINLGLEDSDFEWGPRITIGRRFDCVNGYEVVYAGQLEWEQRQQELNPGFDTILVPALPLVNADIDPFLNSDRQAQLFRAKYDSIEFNRTYNGWDVLRASLGLRTILYKEDFAYGAEKGADRGLLTQSVDNVLIGPQVGLDMYYPISNRCFIGSRIKGGVYLNIADSDTRLRNNAFIVAGSSVEDEEIAGMFEFQTKLGYHLTDSITATIGYDVWYLAGIATSRGQIRNPITQDYGRSFDMDDDVLIHGATAGLEVTF